MHDNAVLFVKFFYRFRGNPSAYYTNAFFRVDVIQPHRYKRMLRLFCANVAAIFSEAKDFL